MLDKGVSFTDLGSNSNSISGDQLRTHFFVFKVPVDNYEEKYSLEFHEFPGSLFIGKYFPTRYSKLSNRYSVILNYNVRFACIVLRTVTDIFLHVYRKYPRASFGFIGEPRNFVTRNDRQHFTALTKESENSSKRFSLYKLMCFRDIDPNDFIYAEIKSKSAILMINSCVTDQKQYLKNVEDMMVKNYEYFE